MVVLLRQARLEVREAAEEPYVPKLSRMKRFLRFRNSLCVPMVSVWRPFSTRVGVVELHDVLVDRVPRRELLGARHDWTCRAPAAP